MGDCYCRPGYWGRVPISSMKWWKGGSTGVEYEFSYAAAEQEVGGWGRQLGPLHTERCEQAGGTVMCHVAGSGFRTNEEDVAKWQRVAAGHVCIPCLSDWACKGGPGFGESTCAEGHTGIMCG